MHIPAHTNRDVELILGGESRSLREGECWYLNFDLGHALANRGVSDRDHVVIDARVNPWLTTQFERLRSD
ncbi:MAG: aspartyl/asparaginyl beta-hydroxylase domain-containing protein [Rudaea sp.]